MPYIPNTDDDRREMLRAIGLESIDELFRAIPASVRLSEPPAIGRGLTEQELGALVQGAAKQNRSTAELICFLGAGYYDHFIPAVVEQMAARNEFYTAYTPYQPEASQGSLQAFFEYQSMICELTGMEVSNASLYDGASAAAEAALMAISVTRRYGRVLISRTVHPHIRAVVRTYVQHLDPELVELADRDGVTDVDGLEEALTDESACVVVQHPNALGLLEPMSAIRERVSQRGALLVQIFDPISLGILRRPGPLGVDIAVAEGQSLGIPLQLGGPGLGILACRRQHMRRMPGRLVGATLDRDGRRCFVLTLQTREQHIRREKATSNICTNQGLLALRAAIYLAALGPHGLRETAERCTRHAHYLAQRVASLPGVELAFPRGRFFKEFVVRFPGQDAGAVAARMLEQGILAGLPLGSWYPELGDCLLVAVTEKRTRAELDRYVAALRAAL